MSRTRAYTRKMRAKAIKRKKRITSHYPGSDTFPYYSHDGIYSKNKIHCSCRMCRGKDYYGRHIPTLQEKRNGIGLKYPTLNDDINADMVELADTPA